MTTSLPRRVFLRRSALASAVLLVPACAPGASGGPDEDGGVSDGGSVELPHYDYKGPLGPADLFRHGVASGDPLADSVILWTRVSPELDGALEVFYEVAEDLGFTKRVAAGTVSASDERDYTVKLDVTSLRAGTTYYYRFFSLGRGSRVGRTRTAPVGSPSRLRFAVMSCASYQHGYFHAYQRIADRLDLDAVIHLGDYVYEYGPGEYGSARSHLPPHEAVTLADYRGRHGQYKRDAQLQQAHAQHPFICVWDDHEVADNSWRDGAENHQPAKEGDYATRKSNAIRAWHEWMPARERSDLHIHRSFEFGDLAELVMLDTRIEGRDEQVGTPSGDNATRTLLGTEQETWLTDTLVTSRAKWKLLGQQVMMAQLYFAGITVNTDQWDGYASARARFYGMIRQKHISNLVVLTGDIHSSWAADLVEAPLDSNVYTPATGKGSLGVEFVTPAVTSPALEGPLGSLVETFLGPSNPHIKYNDFMYRGFIVLDVRPEKVQADFFNLDGVGAGQGDEFFAAAMICADGAAHLTKGTTEESPVPNPPAPAPPGFARLP